MFFDQERSWLERGTQFLTVTPSGSWPPREGPPPRGTSALRTIRQKIPEIEVLLTKTAKSREAVRPPREVAMLMLRSYNTSS
jgi:hypothetical protein